MPWAANPGVYPDYWAVRVQAPMDRMDAVLAWFYDLGVTGVQWDDGNPATPAFTDIALPAGEPFVQGFFPDDDSWPGLSARIDKDCKRRDWQYAVSRVATEDWANAYKKYYRPIALGEGYGVVPAWYEASPFAADKTVWMDPGMAFGTGSHATTRSCLDLMIQQGVRGQRVLDLGSGSGILAIMANKLGARSIDAVEPDPVAVSALTQNVGLNRADERVHIIAGTLDDIPAVEEYDVICMNLIADLILGLWPQVAARLKNPRGYALLSGIVEERVRELEILVDGSGFSVSDYWYKDHWATLVVRPI